MCMVRVLKFRFPSRAIVKNVGYADRTLNTDMAAHFEKMIRNKSHFRRPDEITVTLCGIPVVNVCGMSFDGGYESILFRDNSLADVVATLMCRHCMRIRRTYDENTAH